VAVDALAHEVVVEGAGAGGRVDCAQIGGEFVVAGYRDAVAALLPEEEFE
jgi:hypothetical protein